MPAVAGRWGRAVVLGAIDRNPVMGGVQAGLSGLRFFVELAQNLGRVLAEPW
jgi:hypothetical protein